MSYYYFRFVHYGVYRSRTVSIAVAAMCYRARRQYPTSEQSCSQDRKFRDQDQGQDQQCQDQDRDQDRHLQDQDQDQDQVAVHNKMRTTYKLLNMLSTTEDCNQMTMSTSTQKLFCAQTMFSCSLNFEKTRSHKKKMLSLIRAL